MRAKITVISIVLLLLVLAVLAFSPAEGASPPSGPTVHVVRWGENLTIIARRYGTTVEAIMRANRLTNPNRIYVGQRLVIPQPQSTPLTQPVVYVVQWGDTLYSIAHRYGTTVEAIMQANGLRSWHIYAGQRLTIPAAVSGTPQGGMRYTVRRGDTLTSIAYRFGTTVQAIVQANRLYNPSLIYVGQVLIIPAAPGAQPATGVVYTVKPGDTLASIAYRFGVDPWSIAMANNIYNMSLIYVGQRLWIPGVSGPRVTPTPVPPSVTCTPTPTPTSVPDAAYGERIYNGSFEEGFEPTGVGKGWLPFGNGNAHHHYADDDLPAVVWHGKHAQLMEMGGVTQPDRYIGIYQRVRVAPGARYELMIHGVIRSDEGSPEASGWGHRIQYGIDYDGGTDWEAVEEWVDVNWDDQPRRAESYQMGEYRTIITARSDHLTLFIRGWKKWEGRTGEVSFNLDGISLRGLGAPPPTPTPTPPPGASATPTSTPADNLYIPTLTPTPTVTPQVGATGGRMKSPEYGMQAFLWWHPEITDRVLQQIKLAGFGWLKHNFAWRDIEGAAKGHFDWTQTDRIVDAVQKHGLKLLVRVDHQPAWAGGGYPTNGPPDDYNDFGDFVEALARRYKGRIHAYEIWNEPNLRREWGGRPPNAAEYVRLLKIAYQRIKAVDPNALVITAGLSPTGTGLPEAIPDDQYLRQMYEAGAKGYFDALGVHAPGYKAPPEVSPDEAAANKEKYGGERFFCFRRVEDLRAIMVEYGDADTQVVVLELGWTTDPRPDSPYHWHAVAEQQQADYLVRAYKWAREHWSPWIGLMCTIYIADPDWDENDEQYYWSIILPDGRARPAYAALVQMPK